MAAHRYHNRRRQQNIHTRPLQDLEEKYSDELHTLQRAFSKMWRQRQSFFRTERYKLRAHHERQRSRLSIEHDRRRTARLLDQQNELWDLHNTFIWLDTYSFYQAERDMRASHRRELNDQRDRHQLEKWTLEMRHRQEVEEQLVDHQQEMMDLLEAHQHNCQLLRESVDLQRQAAMWRWLRS